MGLQFGEGSTPALHGKYLIVVWDHIPGRAQVIVNAMNRVRSYDLETGKIVWEGAGTTMNVIPTPVFGHGMVFIMSGFRGNSLKAIKLAGAKGDISTTGAIAWQLDRDTPYVPSPLLYDNILYFLKTNNGLLSAYDAVSGKPHYQVQRLPKAQEVFASPVGADGRVYRYHAFVIETVPGPVLHLAGSPSASTILTSIPSSRRPRSMCCRSPTTTQTKFWVGTSLCPASSAMPGVTERTRCA